MHLLIEVRGLDDQCYFCKAEERQLLSAEGLRESPPIRSHSGNLSGIGGLIPTSMRLVSHLEVIKAHVGTISRFCFRLPYVFANPSTSIKFNSSKMSAPPLPDVLAIPKQSQDSQNENQLPVFRRLKTGCWLLNYAPINSPLIQYDGTLRIENVDGGLRASGDLYQRPLRFRFQVGPRPILTPGPPPDPSKGIPVLPISNYTFFIRATGLMESVTVGNQIELGLELWRYSHTAWTTVPTVFPNWVESIPCTATMKWLASSAPSGFPVASRYLEGDVKDGNGNSMGKLTMGWISDFLRKATVEIDTVAGSEAPIDSGSGHNWSTVGTSMGYDLTIIMSEQTVPEMTGESWSNAEMHSAMLAHRDSNDLDKEWRYHILAVKNIDETPRGIMYDLEATDSNKVPREGVSVSTHWIVPEDWGSSSGVRFGLAKAAHFRTAVHELGHALGLNRHNTIDLGFMNTSDAIAAAGNTGQTPFPDNIKWAFADDDLRRLRHRSDMYIRPGGVQYKFINDNSPSQSADSGSFSIDNPDLELILTPLLTEVPVGAPVRIELKLTNNGKSTIPIPERIDLKSDAIRGSVTDPSGTIRTFKSLIGCHDETSTIDLAPNQSVTQSITLLRGGEGALFPVSGVSSITIDLSWSLPTTINEGNTPGPYGELKVSANTTVFIIGASTETRAKAAHKVLTSPDLHLLIAFGGGSKQKRCCEETLGEVLDCDVLGPHWEFFVLKERLTQGDKNAADRFLKKVDKLIASKAETMKLRRLLK